jgi:cysteinyl-tRNA synthetase
LLRSGLEVFGLETLAEFAEPPKEIRELAERREEARKARDYEQADLLRQQIESFRWEIRDSSDGYTLVPQPE